MILNMDQDWGIGENRAEGHATPCSHWRENAGPRLCLSSSHSNSHQGSSKWGSGKVFRTLVMAALQFVFERKNATMCVSEWGPTHSNWIRLGLTSFLGLPLPSSYGTVARRKPCCKQLSHWLSFVGLSGQTESLVARRNSSVGCRTKSE